MFKKVMLAISLLCTSPSAYALVNAEVFFGNNWYHSQKANDTSFYTSGKSLSLGVHFDPVPLVPVSVGANYMSVDLEKSDFTNAGSAKINQIALDLKVWAPMVPIVTPYLRLRYIANSRLNVTYDNGQREDSTRLSGYAFGLGCDYKIIPLVHAMLEYTQSFERIDEFAGKNRSFNSRILSLGLQVGV